MTPLFYVIGAVIGALVASPFFKSSTKSLTHIGYLCLAIVLMIYFGAHVITGDQGRILGEAVFVIAVLGVATVFRKVLPIGIGFLVVAHIGYDMLFSHAPNIPSWFPAICVGFNMVVGTALIHLINLRREEATKESSPE